MSDNKYPVETDTSKPFQLVRMTWKEDGEGKTFPHKPDRFKILTHKLRERKR